MAKSNRTILHWLKWPLYTQVSIVVLFIILFFGVTISFIEPNEFPTMFDGIWWALITLSTVGFGDYVPQTYLGRAIAMLMVLVGASFVSAYFATISAAAIRKQHSFREGEITFRGSNQIILIGWNEKTKEMVESLTTVKPDKKIVLIDGSLKTAPLIENVYYIKGDPTDDETLARANIGSAEAAIITADQHKNEYDADMYSILVLLTLKGVNPSLHCVIEVLTEKQAINAKRAGANDLIKTYKLTSYFMMTSIFAKNGLANFYSELNPASGNSFQVLPYNEKFIGKTFRELSQILLEKECILIGIKTGEETKINPPLTYQITRLDSLIVLKH
ncbi:potassium channel family protein [Metabacillus malikii]|uniref:Voltage-gated potassium channel n=1 Tax=Metabacillus malikii TaxID=1504265 RepID=A0ABT9ZC16_9BACI|nr:potassium channel family protein [Metabacillus malikii]MDQ0229810.1 voltage-gated potassium channel [Metabacillus malikii]